MKIFVSGVTAELGHARQIIKDGLEHVGYDVVHMDRFAPDHGNLIQKLTKQIEACDAMVHVAGFHYGTEPSLKILPARTPRRSATQWEYHIAKAIRAKRKGRFRIYVLLTSEKFVSGSCPPESSDKSALQLQHRARLQEESVYELVNDEQDLEKISRAILAKSEDVQDKLVSTRAVNRWLLWALVGLLALLFAIGLGLDVRKFGCRLPGLGALCEQNDAKSDSTLAPTSLATPPAFALPDTPIDAESIVAEVSVNRDEVSFMLKSGPAVVMTRGYALSIDDAKPVPLETFSSYSMTGIKPVQLLKVESADQFTPVRDLTPAIVRALVESQKQPVERYLQDVNRWNCGIGGCAISEWKSHAVLCNPAVKRVELTQGENKPWLALDRSVCAPPSADRMEICADFRDLPFQMHPGSNFRTRVTFADDTQASYVVPNNLDKLRYALSSETESASYDHWVELKPVASRNPEGRYPPAIVAFESSTVTDGGFYILSGLDGCVKRASGMTRTAAQWLMDQDQKGLVRVEMTQQGAGLPFGPSHRATGPGETRPMIETMMRGESVVGIALELQTGERLGPYWYTFDAKKPVRLAAERAYPPRAKCERPRFSPSIFCEPVDKLAWVGAKRIAIGSSGDALETVFDIDYTIEDFLLTDCGTEAAVCEPFRFKVPDGWRDVYFAITDAKGTTHAVERLNVSAAATGGGRTARGARSTGAAPAPAASTESPTVRRRGSPQASPPVEPKPTL